MEKEIMNTYPRAVCVILASLASPAMAVVVAGGSGGGNNTNNTTATQFASELGFSMPIYENVIRYSDASGIYLGYNAATKDAWVLTARHISSNVSQGSAVTIDGLVYNRQSDGVDGLGILVGGDLRLVRYSRPDLAVPTLPAINISTTVPAGGASIYTIGYGRNRVQNGSTNALTSDAVTLVGGTGYTCSADSIKRWGVNQIEAEFPNSLETTPTVAGTTGTFAFNGYETTGYVTDFDQPNANQWLSSNESQASLGDSGGGAFYRSGGAWYLSGIYTGVVGFSGQQGSSSAFGNLSLLTDVATYSGAINTALGGVTLVPEPSSVAMVLLVTLGLFSGRRRAS
jgi:hypothetical protein